MDNPQLRDKLQIFALFPLSTGVDNDANEEEYAFVLVTTQYTWMTGKLVYIVCVWQGQIVSTMVSRRHESNQILLCQ